jgi:hypothetical protein
MRVVVSPVLVDDRICRIVSAVESLLEVEEWVGAWWEPSSVPLTAVSNATSAPPELLRARGVPEADIATTAIRLQPPEVEALMRGTDPHRPSEMRFDEETVSAVQPAKPRTYPGNARFRRSSAPTTESDVTPNGAASRRPVRDATAAPPDTRP